MDYLSRIREIEITKETKKASIEEFENNTTKTKETKYTKEAISAEEAKKATPSLTVQPGDLITWTRVDGTAIGLVEAVHVDVEGIAWAFVTIGQSWAWVNLKFAKRVNESM